MDLFCFVRAPAERLSIFATPPVQDTVEALPPSHFEDWKQQFAQRAAREGYDRELTKRLLNQAIYQERSVQADRQQPEKQNMIWDYLDRIVTPERIAQGRALLAQQTQTFMVPSQYVMAIWGIESAYGKNMGKHHLPSTLATLAYDGRRREFAEQQLFALMQLLQTGALSEAELYGSWAGGMGHTQFIPATFLQYGVDGDEDGVRSPFQLADALASTAHYLSASGWQAGSWGEVVSLPSDFDYLKLNQKLNAKELNLLGVKRLSGRPFTHEAGRLWLPAGREGSALLLYPNFDVIQVYNRSPRYALAVALLADAIAGQETPLHFPRHERGLNQAQAQQLQEALQAQGYEVGKIDGVIGRQTQQAFQAWQHAQGLPADGFISLRSASALLSGGTHAQP